MILNYSLNNLYIFKLLSILPAFWFLRAIAPNLEK